MASENGVEVDSQGSYNDTENDQNQDSKQKVVALKRPPPFTLKTNFYFPSKEEKEEED